MKKCYLLLGLCLGFVASCATDTEPKVVGPESDESSMPWNRPMPGEGGGAFGGIFNQQR